MSQATKTPKKMTLTNAHTGHSITVTQADLARIQSLQESAQDSLDKGITPRVGIGILATFVLLEPVGLLWAATVGSMFIASAIKKAIANGQSSEWIQRSDNFCHRLSNKQLAQVTKIMGIEPVKEQLLTARDAGQRLTPAAKQMLRLIDESYRQSTLEEIVSLDPSRQLDEGAIGPATTLEAIETTAEPVTDEETGSPLDAYLKKQVPPAEDVRSHMAVARSLLLISVGGGGKGMWISNLCRVRAAADKAFVGFWIDPKGSPQESGYFAHPQIACYRFDATTCSPAEIAEHIKAAMMHYRALCASLPSQTPVLLILDEWYFVQGELVAGKKATKEALDSVLSSVRAMVSLLDGQHKHLCLVSQSPKTEDILIGGGGLLANFEKVILMKPDERGLSLLTKAKAAQIIPRDLVNDGDLFPTAEQSSVGRAVYMQGQLMPMPVLTNHSQYDRDNRQPINQDKALKITDLSQCPLPGESAQERDSAAVAIATDTAVENERRSPAADETNYFPNTSLTLDDIVSRILKAVESSSDFVRRISGGSKKGHVILRPLKDAERKALLPSLYVIAKELEKQDNRFCFRCGDNAHLDHNQIEVMFNPNGFPRL